MKLRVRDGESYTVADGDGPVNALDQALRGLCAHSTPASTRCASPITKCAS